jgi:hypothetical protein
MGYTLLEEKQFGNARAVFIKLLAMRSSSTLGLIGLAVAELRVGNLRESLALLKEANIVDPHNPELWGYATIVAVKLNKIELANQSLK